MTVPLTNIKYLFSDQLTFLTKVMLTPCFLFKFATVGLNVFSTKLLFITALVVSVGQFCVVSQRFAMITIITL